jgi:hypothetical protein
VGKLQDPVDSDAMSGRWYNIPRVVKNLKHVEKVWGSDLMISPQLFLKPQEQVQSRLDDPV